MAELAHTRLPPTVCPLSNLKLCVVHDLRDHPLKKMLDADLCAIVNSDDPAYFGGYLNANSSRPCRHWAWGARTWVQLARNSFEASSSAPNGGPPAWQGRRALYVRCRPMDPRRRHSTPATAPAAAMPDNHLPPAAALVPHGSVF